MKALDLLCFGELLIDFVASQPGQPLAESPRFDKCAGGAPANVAVGACRLGARAAMISCVGNDPFGDFLVRALDAEGVDTGGIQRASDARTTLAFVSVDADGERDFTFFRHPGADTRIHCDATTETLITRSRVFHFGSLSLTHPSARAATREALDIARRADVVVSMDPNLRLMLWERPAEAVRAVREALPYARVVKVSQEELFLIADTDDEDEGLRFLHGLGPRLILLTRGGASARLFTPSIDREIPGFPVRALDATGAGDSFTAAFWAATFRKGSESLEQTLSDEAALVAACRFAHAAASLTVQSPGAIPALPTKSTVEARLREAPSAS